MRRSPWEQVAELRAAAEANADAGHFDTAREQAHLAAQLALKAGGQADPRVAECFYHLADLHSRAGDLTAAEPAYNAASSILNPTEGEATPLKADLLLDYGTLYAKMRLGWRAILLIDHAKSRFTELYGPDSDGVGRCHSMMAVSYESAGMEEEALVAYREAHRILAATRGEKHPSVTYIDWCRADLAFWRSMKSGDDPGVAQALADFRAGLRLSEDAEGRDSSNVVTRRAMLGTYLVVNKQFEEGAALLTDAIATLEAAGEGAAAYRRQLARARVQLGDPAGAFMLLRQSIHEDPVGHWVAHGSDRERMASLERVYWNISQYLDLFLASGNREPDILREACDLILSRKALGAELLATQRQAVSRGGNPELASLMTRLAEARAQVAAMRLTGSEVSGEALGEIERIEWELASRVPEMDLDPAMRAVNTASIAANLPADAVLIECVRFTRRETVAVESDAVEDGRRDWYIAFVLTPGGEVSLVDLGAAPELDALIRQYRSSVARSHEGAHDRRDIGRDHDEPSTEDDGSALRVRLVEPLLAGISPRRRLFVATDGDLTRVPFGALPDGAGKQLIDTFDICYLSAGRDLRRLAEHRSAKRGAPLVIADPDYNASHRAASPSSSVPAAPLFGDRDQLRQHMARTGITFSRLPGTAKEGAAIAGLLGVQPYMGDAAREEVVKGAGTPMIVHIATHGFFLPGPLVERAAPDESGNVLQVAAQHPLVRSGLALAGANAWLRRESPSHNVDDGILNGEDIVSMDLTATELVVLSACESGLGDVVAGEGVMGLRRAFAVAGARALVLSLWKVPDEQTQALMTAFYKGLLQGKGKAEALREAQQHVRSTHPEPFYWAAFICQGDPGPVPLYAGRVDSTG